MSARVCLVSTGQPASNPRLVKEADALSAAGYEVRVVGAHWAEWADRADVDLLAGRQWSAEIIDWRRERDRWLFWKSRIRHYLARSWFEAPVIGRTLGVAAAGRLTPELLAAAGAWRADLYIAHNLGALPAAALAARRYGARLGFDAEDYHRGQFADGTADGRAIVQAFEERYLPLCDYVTAASPGIADAYAPLCQTKPDVILNVFPLADRPPSPPARADGRIRLYWFSQLIGGGRGLEHVASALGQLQDLPVELHVRGTWQPGFAARLSDIVRGAGGSPDRLVSHGPGAPSEMARLAAACDVGLALEIGDTRNSGLALSNKIFTYLLAGLPVLATATEAQAALGRELGPAIALTPIGDVRGMADAIRRWATDLAALAAARQAAWALAETRYNWDIEQQRFLRVVRTALGDRSRRHPEGVAS